MPESPRNVNLVMAITWLVGATPIVPFLYNKTPPPHQFIRKNILLKKNLLEEMLIEQIIDYEFMGPGPPCRTCTPKLVVLMAKQKKILKGDLLVDYYC